jgi:L-aminopeptidase/D-esterase-like protein
MVPAGIGSWAAQFGDVIVGVLVLVNAVGDIRNARGEIIAGKVDSLRYLAEGGAPLGRPERLNHNTTLAVIATNADLDRVQLQALAQSGSDALARRITPYGTLFDGDVIFAVTTATVQPKSPLQVEAIAALVVPDAVERSVRRG